MMQQLSLKIEDPRRISKRLQWLGLLENPYLPYPDGRYFIPLAEQKAAYQDITATISDKSQRNVCVVVGEPGTGKSALAQRLVAAAFHGSYLWAVGVHLTEDDATPAKMVKKILTSIGSSPVKVQKDRLKVLRDELENRMIVLNESVFLAVDTEFREDALETVQEIITWSFEGKSLVQVAIFQNRDALYTNHKDLITKAGVMRTLSAPSIRELADLLNTLARMAGRSAPLFTDQALAHLIDRSQRNLGQLMRMAEHSLQVLIESTEQDTINETIVESLYT